MEKITLYRGITLTEGDVDRVLKDIRFNGLYITKDNFWRGFILKNLKNELKNLFDNPKLSRKETEASSKWIKTTNGSHREYTEGDTYICFADKSGAEYYALKHNITKEKTVPILIKASIEIENIMIDGRDFLYTVFGNMNPKDIAKVNRQIKVLKNIYGEKIEMYIQKIINHPDSEKYAVCDLVVSDNDIIKHHSKNEIVIGGRNGTLFQSAFMIKIPVLPSLIESVEVLAAHTIHKSPMLTLNDILGV